LLAQLVEHWIPIYMNEMNVKNHPTVRGSIP